MNFHSGSSESPRYFAAVLMVEPCIRADVMVMKKTTLNIMMAIMGVAVDRRATPGFAGLIIGLTVAGIITTLGNITGSSLNPARTFGPFLGDLLLGGANLWSYFPIYVVGPVVGAVLAAFAYNYMASE